jgi:hypothetical protein
VYVIFDEMIYKKKKEKKKKENKKGKDLNELVYKK